MLSLVIYKEDVINRPTFLHIKDVPNNGHKSVYFQHPSILDFYKEHQSLMGYSQLNPVVGSCFLYVDFDDGEESASEFSNTLNNMGVGYSVYTSGNKGYHFHIPRNYVESRHLPNSDRQFIRDLAPKADLNIYKHTGLLRVKGTIHKKTGRVKELLKKVNGKKIKVPIVEKVEVDYKKGRKQDLNIFSDPFINKSIFGFKNGDRNNNLFILIMKLKDCGCSNDFISEFVEAVNHKCDPPFSEVELNQLFFYHLK